MSLLLCLSLAAAGSSVAPAQAGAAVPDAFAQSTQMIVVTTPNWDAVDGKLQRYQRRTPHEAWQPVSQPISIVVGKRGLAWGIGVVATDGPGVRAASGPVKKEGDGKSPAGIFSLGTAFGYAPQPLPGLKLPYLTLTPSIECVDDAGSKFYNRIVDRSTVTPDWNSSEHMRNTGESYRWGIVVDHNGTVTTGNANPPMPGGGSCVFMHIWGGPGHGTAGCTAMTQNNLETLLIWLDPARKPLLVQLPAAEYGRLMNRWKLPTVINIPAR